MHAANVGCTGQTLALAKCSDYGGKKSRIRRSKEERKAMAESFIKKYQESNNGSFPSLNLAHKEVGGSFYTVREIVREIIQENRVLGPPKLIGDEQKIDQFSEQYPLGSIATEPQVHLSMLPNDSYHVSTQSICEEVISTASEQCTDQQQQTFDNKLDINGTVGDKESKEADAGKSSAHVIDEMLYTDVHISHNMDLVENTVKVSESTAKVTPGGVTVFSGHSSAKLKQKTDEQFFKAGEFAENVEVLETGIVEVACELGKTTYLLNVTDSLEKQLSSGLLDEKSDENIADACISPVRVNDQMLHSIGHISQTMELVESTVKESESTSNVTPIRTDVTLFPVQSSAKLNKEADEQFIEAGELDGNMQALETGIVEVASEPCKIEGDVTDSLDKQQSSRHLDEKSDETNANANKSSACANDEMLYTDAGISHNTELVENVVEVSESTSKVTTTATDDRETFPIQSAVNLIEKTDDQFLEAGQSAGIVEVSGNKVEVAAEPGIAASTLDVTDSIEKQHSSGPLNEKPDVNNGDPSLENFRCSSAAKSIEGSILEVDDLQVHVPYKDDLTLQTTNQSNVEAGTEPRLASNNAPLESYSDNASKNQGGSLPQPEVTTETGNENPSSFNTNEGRQSTLNRRLEKWEEESKKPTEANPVWGVLRAFLTAFIKFWTE